MAEVPAPETSWESSPGIIDGAMSLQLTAQGCDLDYWIRAVAQGTLARLVHGHRATAGVPEFMKRPGPLREALIHEMAFRSMAEEKATRAIADLVRIAPGLAEMEFYVTQLFDEAGHARVFRGHIVELGVPPEELTELIEGVVDRDRERILAPLEEFAEPIRASDGFIAGVVMLTVLVEGVLAPAAEMSERKWRPLDPAVAEPISSWALTRLILLRCATPERQAPQTPRGGSCVAVLRPLAQLASWLPALAVVPEGGQHGEHPAVGVVGLGEAELGEDVNRDSVMRVFPDVQ